MEASFYLLQTKLNCESTGYKPKRKSIMAAAAAAAAQQAQGVIQAAQTAARLKSSQEAESTTVLKVLSDILIDQGWEHHKRAILRLSTHYDWDPGQ